MYMIFSSSKKIKRHFEAKRLKWNRENNGLLNAAAYHQTHQQQISNSNNVSSTSSQYSSHASLQTNVTSYDTCNNYNQSMHLHHHQNMLNTLPTTANASFIGNSGAVSSNTSTVGSGYTGTGETVYSNQDMSAYNQQANHYSSNCNQTSTSNPIISGNSYDRTETSSSIASSSSSNTGSAYTNGNDYYSPYNYHETWPRYMNIPGLSRGFLNFNK